MTALDVAAAVRRQNVAAAPGRVGQPPGGRTRSFQFPLDTLGRLSDPEQFGDIIVKAGRRRRPDADGRRRAGAAPAAAGPAAGGRRQPAAGAIAPAGTTRRHGRDRAARPVDRRDGAGGTTGGGSTVGRRPRAAGGTGGRGRRPGGSHRPARAAPPARPATPTAADPNGTAGGTPLGATAGGAGGGAGGRRDGRRDGRGRTAWPAGRSTAGRTRRPAVVRLRDVARVELGAADYNNGATFDGKPSVGLAIHLLPGANALDVADRVRAQDGRAEGPVPRGDRVRHRLRHHPVHPRVGRGRGADAVRGGRPGRPGGAAVPPELAGRAHPAGRRPGRHPRHVRRHGSPSASRLNNISLFGLVLAIGIVVDDAIVVVENVERWLEHGLAPKEAAYKAMEEVTGPVVAIALVLCAVFVPCAFVGGITGQFFRQFAVTITASTVFSAINSLTLSPALAAILLRPQRTRSRDPLDRGCSTSPLGLVLPRLQRGVRARAPRAYAWVVGRLLRGQPGGAGRSTAGCSS